MYAYNQGTTSSAYPIPQGHIPNSAIGTVPGHASNPAYTPTPNHATALSAVPTPTPTPPILSPVQVPSGCYAIELTQFWRSEYKRGHPFPLHWALFVRTAPRPPSPGPGSVRARRPTTTGPPTPRGNFYEIVGNPDTYTAQFLPNVTFEPDALADWRGSHVIGWVNPGQLAVFEAVVRQVPVWRQKPDWRSQQWVYEVVKTVGRNYQGVFVEGGTFGGLQKHMGRLLDAWENGDI